MKLLVCNLGTMAYGEALVLQRAVARARISGAFDEDLLLLVEHPPVVTLGRSSKEKHLLASPALLAARGVELHEIERGGDVTFHGPGQLVGYTIIDLKRHKQDLHWFLRQVEEAVIRAIAPLGLVGERSAGYTGVWTGGRKLASIGVHARDWVTWHGFALNVTTDLSWFDLMVPCGIAAVEMTSVAKELKLVDDGADNIGRLVRSEIVDAFAGVFALEAAVVDLSELERVAATTATA
ncbi:MAG: lipoyl(octanoyl) transferase LipB [Gemmatimonadaceae bacterium]